MKEFSHLNILPLIGVALDTRLSPCLIMPYMTNGSLCEFLRKDGIRRELLLEGQAEVENIESVEKGRMG